MANQTDWAEATEQQVLDAALTITATQGWTWPSVRAAGKAAALSAAETELLLPHGPADLAALLSRRHDARALAALPDPATLKIRERIRAAVAARIDAAAEDEAAVRRWSGYLSLPLNFTLGLKLLWESADALWRWAGDTATDENHYSKRAILSGILATALAIRLSSGREAAMTFVDARIENVMSFEKWKAGLKPADLMRDVAAALGKMRYG
ncbi:COQ9 family protein [Phenylobacterium sp.]|uniref:COQ9 family protein n=1 Tax=Phenylobacterium sp. TaxID=1871053 RepID=UPI00272F54E5|nr:COQ9 family protein [Phenylobacterium sp.]MDP1600862.1 COQ9 family protein [Phenylobacterium sp.]MDP3593192.1 COQ9 family protein [Phenylobacterium sp.]